MPSVKINPMTGRPVEETARLKDEAQAARYEKTLEDQSAVFGISKTPDGQFFVDLVQKRFQARVEALVAADPEAKALESLLSDLGVKERQGQMAALKLADLRLRRSGE